MSAPIPTGNPSTSKRPRSPQPIRKVVKKKCSEDDENMLMEKALTMLDQRSDEWDIFGQFVASELRQIFNCIERNNVKRSIMKVLLTFDSPKTSGNGYTSETAYVIMDDSIHLDC